MTTASASNWLDADEAYRRLANDELPSRDDVACLLSELRRLRSVSAYLASCHAATAEHDGMLKSTSKSRRDRLRSICEKAVQLLRGERPTTYRQTPEQALEAAIGRCERAANDIKGLDK